MVRAAITKEESSRERKVLRQRVAEPEALEAEHQADKESLELGKEQLYKAVFDSANDVILLMDKRGKIINVNERLTELGGYEREELIGKNIRSLAKIITRKSMAIVISKFLKRMAGAHVLPYEVEMLKKDGESLTIEISARPLKKDGKIIGDLAILRDITERKQAEDDIRQKSSELQLINSIGEAVNQGNSFEEIIQLVSEGTQKLFGGNDATIYLLSKDKQYMERQQSSLSPKTVRIIEKMIGMKIPAMRIPLKAGGIYTEILKTGKAQLTNDPVVIRKMASEFTEDKTRQKVLPMILRSLSARSIISVPLDSGGEVFGLLEISKHEPFIESDVKRLEIIAKQLVNVIKRKQTEEALQASEQNLRNTIDNSPLGIRVVTADGQVSYSNQALADIYGCKSIEELLATPLEERYTPQNLQTFQEGKRKALSGEPVPPNYELDIVRKDGTSRHMEVFRKPILWDGQNQFQMVYRDITEQKLTEEALQVSEKNFRSSFDNLPLGIHIVAMDGDTIYVNQAMLDICGYESPEEMRNTPAEERYTPESYLEHLQRKESRKRGEPTPDNYRISIVRKDGTIRHLEAFRKEVLWGGKPQLQMLYHDITERRKAEQELRESRTRFRELSDLLPQGIWETDKKGMVTYANDAARKMRDYAPQDGPMTHIQLTAPEDRERIGKDFMTVVRGETLNGIEYAMLKKGGGSFPALVYASPIVRDGKIVGARGITLDITERRKAEEVLRQESDRAQTYLDITGVVIVAIDTEGKITLINRQGCEVLGFEANEIIGKNWFTNFIPERMREEVLNVSRRILAGEIEPLKQYINQILTRNGEERTIAWNNVELRDETGKIIGTLSSGEDITERKKAEQALRDSEEKFRNSMDGSPLGIILMTPKEEILYANQSFLDIGGYNSLDEMKSNPLPERYTPESHAEYLVRWEKRRRGESQPIEYEVGVIRKDGTVRHLRVFSKDVPWGGNQQIQMSYIDITEQKRAQEELKLSEQRLKDAQAIGKIGSWELDVATQKIEWSDEVYRLHERDKSQRPLSDGDIPKYYDIEQTAILRKYVLAAIETGQEQRYDVMKKLPSGKTAFFHTTMSPVKNADGRVVKLFGTVQDITERKQVEDRLRESRARFRELANLLPQGVWESDDKGMFTYSNAKVREMYGYTEGDSQIRLSLESYIPEDRERISKNFMRIMRGETLDGIEYTLQTRDGKPFPVMIYASPITRDDKIVGVRGITVNIAEQKQAESALKESEKKYRQLVETAQEGIWTIDDEQRITFANLRMAEMLGYTTAEMMGKSIFSFTDAEGAEIFSRQVALRRQDIKSEYENVLIGKDGKRVHARLGAAPIFDSDGKFVGAMAVVIDITEQKQAEEQIRRGYDIQSTVNAILKVALEGLSLENILKRSVDLVLSIPWLTFEASGSIFLVEDDPRVLVMKAQNGLAQPIQRECARVPFGRCICGQAALTQEIQFVDCLNEHHEISYDGIIPHGHYCVPIMSVDKVLGVLNIYVKEGHRRDKSEEEFLSTVADVLAGIIERKRAQERIEQAAQEWRVTFDSFTDMIFILDNDFRITRVNRAYANMLKKEPKELIGKTCYELINRDCPHDDCPHRKTLQTGKPARAEFVEPTLGIYVEVSTSPIFAENGNIKGSVHVMRDISEHKQMEQQLMLTDRLVSVGELAAGIAHELNNPLTSVIGFSQLLIEGEIPDNIKEDLSLINSEALRAAAIVKNLLTFARKHAAVKQSTQINNIIEDVLKLRAYEQKVNNIEVIKKFAPDLPEIMVDYFQIQQVFLNLVINAEFFMTEAHHRGTLTISIERIDDAVRISFADDGSGIPQENLSRIFDPFFTTKEVGKGTGLGLSICHGIISEHDGKIHAESEVGKGATFIIELPFSG